MDFQAYLLEKLGIEMPYGRHNDMFLYAFFCSVSRHLTCKGRLTTIINLDYEIILCRFVDVISLNFAVKRGAIYAQYSTDIHVVF